MTEKNTIEKLKEIVEQREERFNLSGGEVFVWWGVLTLLAHNIFNLLFPNMLVWIGMIVIGNAGMITYIIIISRGKFKTFWGKMLAEFWVFWTVLLIFIFYVFPFGLKLYPPTAIYPLILFALANGMYVSGLITERISFKAGAIAFLLSSIYLAFDTTKFFLVYNIGTILGLVIPGIWSLYEKRK
jgi:hypothetical protein